MKRLIVKFLKWYFQDELWSFYSLQSQVSNQHADFLHKEKMLRMRIFFLEKELGLENSFHRAETYFPDGPDFSKFDYEYVRINV